MKKSFTRVLSLVLVLVMMLGVLPLASAEGVSAGNASLTLNDGRASTNVSVQSIPLHSYTWSVSPTTGASVSGSGSTATFTATAAGTYTVTCVVKGKITGNKETYTTTIAVSPESTEHNYSVTLSQTSLSLKVGASSSALTATVKEGETTVDGATVAWSLKSGSSNKISVSGGVVSVAADATASDTATVVATYTPTSGTPVTAECAVTVRESDYTVAMIPATLTLNLGQTSDNALTVTVKDAEGQTVTEGVTTENWTTTDATVATISSEKKVVAASKSGTATISADVKVNGTKVGTASCVVTVGSGTITIANIEETASSTQTTKTLNPTFSGGSDYDTDDVTFKFTKVGSRGTIAVNETTGVITYTGPSAIVVKVEAYDKQNTSAKVGEVNVTASFYAFNSVEVTMKSEATELTFGSTSDIQESGSLLSQMLTNYGVTGIKNENDLISFAGLSATEGTFSGSTYSAITKNITVASASNMKFTVGTAGTATFSYTITPTDMTSAVLCKGSVTIKYDGALADIAYSTTYNKSVTFDESDFYKFWASANKTSALDYVTFSIGTLYPAYGTLYTSTTSTATAYKATASHKFYYGSFTSGTNNKDLGSLTYVPNSTKTNTYDVTIPFTAYGTTASETVSGTVVIHMNPNDNNISSRGIFFGTVYDNKGTTTTTDDLTYADQLAEIYYNATGKELGFVVFTLPAAEKATLYSKLPTSGGNTLVAQGTRLSSNVKVYYKSTSSLAADLGNVALVPAAGFSGALTVSFTGYDAAGNNEKTCSITFNVTTKTASSIFSDVTAKGYSWAADSVDFLYYEGTAQGSNGKYNPAAYITRQDFMLMLYRAFLEEDYGTYNVSSNFPDVVKGSTTYSKEIYQAVGVAKYLGIAQGTNNKFNPTSNITRQEAMVLIYRTLEVIGKDLRTSSSVKATSFKDYSKIGSWATTAIGNLVSHGVIQGTNDYINPLSNITRAEMACILHRVITY